MRTATSIGPSRTRRCTPSSTTWCARPAPTSTGAGMYETMTAWETDATLAAQSDVIRDFAQIWQAADKIVYSRTLKEPSTARTRIEREFDPEAVRKIKASARADMTVGGPDLAAQAFRSG